MKNILLKCIQEKNSNRYLLVNANGRTYNISKMLYHMLYEKQQNIPYKDIANEMNKLFETNNFTEIFIQQIIENTLAQVRSHDSLLQINGQQYIFMKQTIIAAGKWSKVYRLLSVLFKKNMSTLLVFLSVIATIYFFCTDGGSVFSEAYNETMRTFTVGKSITLYGCFLTIILIHELGHAAAAYRFGIEPQEIGFGLYFIFPVFYTNVTSIWALPAKERAIVNLAGIYFQLIVNLLLLLLFYTSICSPVCFVLIVGNTIGILSALNPFLRYDGYWLFSDIFNIPNLHDKSWGIYISILKGKLTFKNNTLSLLLYSLFKSIFWLASYYYCILFFINSVYKVQHLTITGNNKENTLVAIILSTFSFLVLFFIPLKLIWSITKIKQYATK